MASIPNIADSTTSNQKSRAIPQHQSQRLRSTRPERRAITCHVCGKAAHNENMTASRHPECVDCQHKKTVTRKHAYLQLRDADTQVEPHDTDDARDYALADLPSTLVPEEQGYLTTIQEEDEDRRSSATGEVLMKQLDRVPESNNPSPSQKKQLTEDTRTEFLAILQELGDAGIREIEKMIWDHHAAQSLDLKEKNQKLRQDRKLLAEENRKLKEDHSKLQQRLDCYKRGEHKVEKTENGGRSGLPSKAKSQRIPSKSSMSHSISVNGSMADGNPLLNTDQLSFSSGVQLQSLQTRKPENQDDTLEVLSPVEPSLSESMASLSLQDVAKLDGLRMNASFLDIRPPGSPRDGRQSRATPRTDSVMLIRARNSKRMQGQARKSTRWSKVIHYFKVIRQEKPKSEKKKKTTGLKSPEKKRRQRVLSKHRDLRQGQMNSHLFTPTPKRKSLPAPPYVLWPVRKISDPNLEEPTRKVPRSNCRTPEKPSRYIPIVGQEIASPFTNGDDDIEYVVTPTPVRRG